MGSLSAHLRQPEQHARLPFHPECPICRDERLVGTLRPVSVIPPRGRATLAAGVLALSAAAPPATIAQEPDQVTEGGAAPDAPAGDRAHSPDFDPGGPVLELPDEPTPPPQAAPPPDAADPEGPVEQEPQADADAPIVDTGDQGEDAGVSPSLPESPQLPTGVPETPHAPPIAPAASPPAVQAPATAPSAPADDQADRSGAGLRGREANKPARARPHHERWEEAHERTASQQSSTAEMSAPPSVAPTAPDANAVAAPPAAATTTAQPAAATAIEPTTSAAARDRIGRGERVYVVRRGDSLWSIAADRLGGTASIAEIAREVDRLWELNRDQIGTGDPDLLRIGTQLTLR